MQYILNPHTGMLVKIGGKTYQELRKQGKINSHSPVFSIPKEVGTWHSKVPMKTKDRILMYRRSRHCFLDTTTGGRPSYPVCTTHESHIRCNGLKSALRNAMRANNHSVQRKALRLLRKHCVVS